MSECPVCGSDDLETGGRAPKDWTGCNECGWRSDNTEDEEDE